MGVAADKAGSARDIEMPAELIAWLGEHRRDQIAERLAATSWKDERLVFASSSGRVLPPPNLRRQLADICERVAYRSSCPTT